MRPRLGFLVCALAFASGLLAQTPGAGSADYRQLAREIFRELVEIPTTESGAASTPAAEALARRFRAEGFAEADVHVLGPSARKMNVVVRLHGKGPGKPILLIGHLDVVEARREDWSPDLDPFKFNERDGYFYGRGTQDMKDGVAVLATNFIRWKREHWVPSRDLILALTADEEAYGDEVGVDWLLKTHRELIDAEYCLNADGGDFQTKEGKPYMITVSAGEKKETMIHLETSNRGGHGSVPRKDNAIYKLVAALARVEKLEFPVLLNEVSRAQFAGMATLESGQLAADMKAVAQVPPDLAAAERLLQDPYYNALLRTTCVATLLEAGHGPSALPQRAAANLNCRIVPGHSPDDVLQKVQQAIADDKVEVKWAFLETGEALASQLRDDVFSTLQRVARRNWPGLTLLPSMETGATDGRFLRTAGVSVYGVSGVFIEQGDLRMHGRDERVRVRDFYTAVDFYDQFMKELLSH
jgi:acetylornithine deacetylase/succinyl-diaminopimelate desuccinylase-like protein